MAIFETVRGTVCTAVETISTVTQSLVEKNRTNAKLNRLRLIMKNESELMNRAYIELGKQYFEKQKAGDFAPNDKQKKLFEVIEKSKAKIAKARDCYRKIVDSQNDIFYGKTDEPADSTQPTEPIVDITVACSNENEYSTSPFENEEPNADSFAQEKAQLEELDITVAPEQFNDDALDLPAEDTEAPSDELF